MTSFGYHEADITPPNNLPLEGYEHRFTYGGVPSGVNDNLYVRALSLADDSSEFILITVDLCILSNERVRRMRERISPVLGVPENQIIISASHTHSGPITENPWEEISNDESSPYIRFQHECEEYMEFVTKMMISSAGEAHLKKTPCACSYTTGCTSVGFNRRSVDEQGDVRNFFSLWEQPGATVDGLVDDEIPVVMIEAQEQQSFDTYLHPFNPSRIVIFNVALHPVVMGKHSRLVSADYPGYARSKIEETLGDGTRAMFLLGACGDTQPLIATQENIKALDVIGGAVAYSVVAALAQRTYNSLQHISYTSTELKSDHADDDDIPITTFTCGEIAFVAVAAECFTEAGLRIRESSPYKQTLIATNTNGWVGYIPTEEAYAQGGYEVVAGKDDVDVKYLERIVQEAKRLLNLLIE